MTKFGGWEVIGEPLGEGGQGEVYLARSPSRVAAREECRARIRLALEKHNADEIANAAWIYARPDEKAELGAVKVLKIPKAGGLVTKGVEADVTKAVVRLRNEIAILGQGKPGLVKLLDNNVDERWFVTEYFPDGSLEKQIGRFKGRIASALRAFRSVVSTVAALHRDGVVHRDIKPANVFIKSEEDLVLGDLGIVFMPSRERVTTTHERVGPRDYMAPWADLGERVEDVVPNTDVYMLGKLLWCMVTGKMKLPRENYHWDQFNVEKLFEGNKAAATINPILERCVVERPERCLQSAAQLLEIVEETLYRLARGERSIIKDGKLELDCKVCRRGKYLPYRDPQDLLFLVAQNHLGSQTSPMQVHAFVCEFCGNVDLFAPGEPYRAFAAERIKVRAQQIS